MIQNVRAEISPDGKSVIVVCEDRTGIMALEPQQAVLIGTLMMLESRKAQGRDDDVAELQLALAAQDRDGLRTADLERARFEVQGFETYSEIGWWHNDQLVMTADLEQAEFLADQIVTAATTILQTENNY